ncbi:24433_t:CDS:2, partial [Gigaspora margarita]
MPHPTNLKQRSKKASEAKEQKNSINIIENSDDSNNASYNEVVKNNDDMGIIKRLQVATKKYDNNTDLKNYDDNNLFAYNELLDESVVKKFKDTVNKYYQEYNFNKTQKKSVEEADEVELNDDEGQLEEVDEDNDIEGPSEDEIEICNWHKKIPTALDDL